MRKFSWSKVFPAKIHQSPGKKSQKKTHKNAKKEPAFAFPPPGATHWDFPGGQIIEGCYLTLTINFNSVGKIPSEQSFLCLSLFKENSLFSGRNGLSPFVLWKNSIFYFCAEVAIDL